METIQLVYHDEVNLKVMCEASTAMELRDYFTFQVPGYKFMPAFRDGRWDGNIRLFNAMARTLYVGLKDEVLKFARERDYEVEIDPRLASDEFSLHEAEEFTKTLGLPADRTPYDYQLEGLATAIRDRRALFVSPTASGKSLTIYLIMRYLQETHGARSLVIVPTKGLVHQMVGDFVSYGYDEEDCHKIYQGQEKHVEHPVVVTTWQSIQDFPKKWFDQFDAIFGDEAHGFTSNKLKGIMEKATKTRFKYGLSGSLDETKTHELVLQGLFGHKKVLTTVKEMMDTGRAARLSIKAIVLGHSKEARKLLAKSDYQTEIDYIVQDEARQNFVKNLALSLKGNTVVIFRFIDKHGVPLYDKIKAAAGDRPVYFIDGSVDGDDRNDLRAIVEQQTNAIIVASVGTFSTGVNIVNLSNLIFCSPSKSRIKVLQSIGRILRKSSEKMSCTMYDIADDLSTATYKNHTLRHFAERVTMYIKEQHKYKLYQVNLKA